MSKLKIVGIAGAALLVIGGVAACSPAENVNDTVEPQATATEDSEKEAFLDTVYDGALMMWDGYTPEMQDQICAGYESIGATTAEGIAQAIEDQGIDVNSVVPVDEIPAGITVDEALNTAFQVFVDECGF